MRRTISLCISFVVFTCLGFGQPRTALAQAFEVVAGFNANEGQPSGRLVEGPPGVFQGTVRYGGRFGRGSLIRIDTSSGVAVTEVHAFTGPDGGQPFPGGLTKGPGGFLYGIANIDGQFGYGTLFRLDSTGRVTSVHDFGPGDVGPADAELLYASDGRLYGTVLVQGAHGVGSVFRIEADGSQVVVHDFDGSDGANPSGALIQASDGWIYGTTQSSGVNADGPGTLFRIDLSGQFQSLHTLAGDEGISIIAGLVEGPDGLFYGASWYGGLHSNGTIFRIDQFGNFEKLHDVDQSAGDGSDIRVSLLSSTDGNLWGVTSSSSNGGGTIFKMTPAGEWTTVHEFSAAEGGFPRASLMVGTDGRMYGTCAVQGSIDGLLGTVYRIDTKGTFELLWTLSNHDGRSPSAGVTEGPDGNLYGTTYYGGADGHGTFFRMSKTGQIDFLHDFDTHDYIAPTPLLRAASGTLYGVVGGNGPDDYGFVFQYPAGGDFSILHAFSVSDPVSVQSRLIEATDGKFYGASYRGGANSLGFVFQLSPDGTLTSVHDFASSEATSPSNLIQASDTKLYFTGQVPPLGQDAILRIDLSGDQLEPLATFAPAAGASPSGLMQATDGDFFGTGYFGGNPSSGTVFHMDDSFVITASHQFDGSDGSGPLGGVVEASDGALYGTTYQGGANTFGTLFRMTTTGTFTKLWDFHGSDGAHPTAPLYQGSDGALYGSTPSVEGVVFRWLLAPATPTLATVEPASGPASGHTSVLLGGTHFQTSPTVTIGPVSAPAAVGLDAQTAVAMSPALTPGTLNDVVLTNPDSLSATLPNAWFADFLDVDSVNPFHDAVESILRAGITAGCAGGNFCGTAPVTRAQMAVLLLKAKHGSDFVPPPCTGLFDDVACPGAFAVDWIEDLSLEGITGGCGGANFCPSNPVRRDQMAVFLLKASLGSAYVPPSATGTVFTDVPASAFAADWIEDLYSRNVTGGCLTNPLRYCPGNTNNRQQMAVFITKTFGLQ